MFGFVFACLLVCEQGLPTLAIVGDQDAEWRTVGGENAPESIPYVASLRSPLGSHICGGSVINSQWVLTAAHCVDGQLSVQVVVGTNSLLTGGDRYYSDKIKMHEEFNRLSKINDIAVVHTSEVIEFNERVQPISLPMKDTGAGVELLLSSWGRTSYPDILPVLLRIITVISYDLEQCKNIYNWVQDTHICLLTRSGEGACHGDSGGPVVEGNTVVGVASWASSCAKGYPSVYTRASSYTNWINQQIK